MAPGIDKAEDIASEISLMPKFWFPTNTAGSLTTATATATPLPILPRHYRYYHWLTTAIGYFHLHTLLLASFHFITVVVTDAVAAGCCRYCCFPRHYLRTTTHYSHNLITTTSRSGHFTNATLFTISLRLLLLISSPLIINNHATATNYYFLISLYC
jgi:hypothetical protein